MRKFLGALALAAAAPVLAQAPAGDPTAYAASADIRAQVAAMAAELKPGQHFLYRPLLKDGVSTAALEYWTGPGAPAVHPNQAEYVVVVAGAGTLLTGGHMTDPTVRNPTLVEGGRIEGGTTRALGVGDAFLVPAGVPHWFGIPGGGRLVMLGIKLDRPAP
jgi:mannose-6-phosphate isomerase-like protein (cupin superfamily)